MGKNDRVQEYDIIKKDVNSFIVRDKPIEYKEVNPDYFEKDGYQCTKEWVEPDRTGYITEVLLDGIDLKESSTEVLNISTGLGKTTAVYKLVEKIYQDPSAVIIMATPFISLVEKDVSYLTSSDSAPHLMKEHVLDYRNLKNLIDALFDEYMIGGTGLQMSEFQRQVTENYRLHVITVHSLLGNPGSSAFEQNLLKTNYTLGLLEYCKRENKKVYLFIDEIHASIQNFQNQFLYNLTRWKDVIHKCFVATATFTEPVNVVIKHLAYLTDDKIHILENNRKKQAKQAKLDILITNKVYSKNDLTDLEQFIPQWLERKGYLNDKTKNFHISCYSKNLAKAIHDNKVGKTHKWWDKKHVKLLTSRSSGRNTFQDDASHIGTTFSTGVNITSSKDALIVIFPCKYGDEYRNGEEGIFSSGLPAILQTIARLRNGGRMLFVIPPVTSIIDCDFKDQIKELFMLDDDIKVEDYSPLSAEESLIDELLKRQSKRIREEQRRYNSDTSNEVVNRPIIQFPTRETFLLDDGQEYIKTKNAMSGKGIIPYVVWAAFHDQFVNCELKSIYRYKYNSKNIIFNSDNIKEKMIQHLECFMSAAEFHEAAFPHFLKAAKKAIKSAIIDNKRHYFRTILDNKLVSPEQLTKGVKNELRFVEIFREVRSSWSMTLDSKQDYFAQMTEYCNSDHRISNCEQEFRAYSALKEALDTLISDLSGIKMKVRDYENCENLMRHRNVVLSNVEKVLDADPLLRHLGYILPQGKRSKDQYYFYVIKKLVDNEKVDKYGNRTFVKVKGDKI